MIHFDCHAHVYEQVASIPGARYTPKHPAPLEVWKKNISNHNLEGGVIVQVSFLGTDNAELCAALSKLDKTRFAGVGVVALDVEGGELDRLAEAGITGLRWNLVHGGRVPDITSPDAQSFFEKLRKRNLHLEVHLEGPKLASHLALLADQGINLVIDHFGLPSEPIPARDPFIQSTKALSDRSNLFVKFSAHYRTAFGLVPHGKALMDLLDEGHVVWGSDWPHTQFETSASYAETCNAVIPANSLSDRAAVQTLYGISAA